MRKTERRASVSSAPRYSSKDDFGVPQPIGKRKRASLKIDTQSVSKQIQGNEARSAMTPVMDSFDDNGDDDQASVSSGFTRGYPSPYYHYHDAGHMFDSGPLSASAV